MTDKKKYKYNRSDFKPLPVKLEHLDVYLNFLDDKVEGSNTLHITAQEPLDTIRLNTRDLEIHPITLSPCRDLEYDYQKDSDTLVVKLPEYIQAGESFAIRTQTTCVPSDNILEGIYKDSTPPGCPQQYMSQCEQWGFQRILPIFDDCTAKCTFVTTIEADARYTHLISNGNISKSQNPDGKPVLKPGDSSRKIITYENFIPMAPYLFIICVGTWDVLEDEIIYPSDRHVKLEYLVPPGRKKGAVVPMKILKEAVLWLGRTQEYEYQRDVYRTICMEKSNFGGMENVGNTTIVTDAALIDEFTGDRRLVYAHGIIIHEFEHNQCGSDVTMETPFDMWLNEAFTVDVEREFLMSRFDPDCMRLGAVDSMRGPIAGPLAIEDAGHMGNIVREGFNNPDELVDGVTYVKAAEVIRMLKLVLGPETFRKAKNLYFKRYNGGNANTSQFFACFEEVSGRDLSKFRNEWLYTIGYPKIEATYNYDEKTRKLHVTLTQTRKGAGGLFHVPFEMAGVDENGKDIPGTSQIVEITGEKLDLTFNNVPRPAFVSFNRNCSFYGTFIDCSATPEKLINQIRLDPNRFNRVEAMRRFTDLERINLVENIDAEVSDEWQETFALLVRDTSLLPGIKAYLLHIDEQSLAREYLPFYRERYKARVKLLKTIANRCLDDLLKAYHGVDTYALAAEPTDGVEERKLKAVLLRTIIKADTPEIHKLAEDHFHRAWNISDKVSALHCINISNHPKRRDLMDEAYELWKNHLSAYASYLQIAGSGIHEDIFEMISLEEKRPSFKIRHPSHSRSLFLPMTANNKILWTDRGIAWVTQTVIRLAPINEISAIRLLYCFQQVNKLAADLKPKVIAALQTMREKVDESATPSVAGRINAYLEGTGTL